MQENIDLADNLDIILIIYIMYVDILKHSNGSKHIIKEIKSNKISIGTNKSYLISQNKIQHI